MSVPYAEKQTVLLRAFDDIKEVYSWLTDINTIRDNDKKPYYLHIDALSVTADSVRNEQAINFEDTVYRVFAVYHREYITQERR